MRKLFDFITDEEGQGMAEYAILMAAIVVVVIIAINTVGVVLKDNLNESGNKIGNI